MAEPDDVDLLEIVAARCNPHDHGSNKKLRKLAGVAAASSRAIDEHGHTANQVATCAEEKRRHAQVEPNRSLDGEDGAAAAAAADDDDEAPKSRNGSAEPDNRLVAGLLQQRGTQPGAIRVEPVQDMATEESSSSSSSSTRNAVAAQEREDHFQAHEVETGLVVAHMVEEEPNLPHAQDFDARATSQQRHQITKQFKTRVFLVVLALIVLLVILVAVLVDVPKGNKNQFLSEAPSSSPSQAPTALADSLLKVFSDATGQAIVEDPNSPQSKAFQWLLEEQDLMVNYTDARVKQRFALATIYFATNGDTWKHNTHWLNHSIHECDWYNKPDFAMKSFLSASFPGFLRGFWKTLPSSRCNSEGLYEHLWLDQNNLMGPIPEELYWLTSLKSLSMGLNIGLEGPISTQIGQLTALEGLAFYLLGNGGSIPSEIGLLSNLRGLGLPFNSHLGTLPTELWQLSKLDTLALNENQLEIIIPSEIGSFRDLRWAELSNCNLSGTLPTEIGLVTALKWLTAFQNSLRGTLPTEVAALSKLTLLSLYDNFIEGSLPSQLGALTSLTQFTGSIPTEFGLLGNLTLSLNFQDNPLLSGELPTELGLLSKLQEMSFLNNGHNGTIPPTFGNLLQRLDFGNNSFTGLIPAELAVLKPSLFSVNFDGNTQLSGTMPPGLCNIYGTCIPTTMNPCDHVPGLSFHCSHLLCGCDCPCD